MHDAREAAAQAEALGTIYAEACERFAVAQFRSDDNPDSNRLYKSMMDAWIAKDYAWNQLLAALHRLEDAGEWIVARNMLRTASGKAQLAECEAMRRELATMKGAA